MRKLIVILFVVAVAVGAGAYYNLRRNGAEPEVMTSPVTRGDIVSSVGATGTLQAVTTVQVGTQVSGTIKELHADFNSIVRRGQVIARLDPSLFQTQVEQARANLIRAQADLERLRVAVDDARSKLARAEGLAVKNLIPASELDAARVAVQSAEAQLKSSQAQVVQAQASLNQTEVNLQHTVIDAPIDGIVISRNVDIGQTVAASMQAPTLFVIAADLAKMQVNASVDEADVGRIRPGQVVRFRVDAYPAEEFGGAVSQVRLQPVVVQNVVTYATVIDVPNPDLKLKPGMTANVTIEIARRTDVLRVPNAALRFRPTAEIYAALGQSSPEGRPDEGGPQAPRQASESSGQAPPQAPDSRGQGSSAPSRLPQATPAFGTTDQRSTNGPGGGQDPDRRRRFEALRERLQNASPEERERMLQRMRERGRDAEREGLMGQPSSPAPPARAPALAPRPPAAAPAGTRTIDSLFGPLAPIESSGRGWLFINRQLKPVRLRLGVSDGSFTELIDGDLQPGSELVTGVVVTGTPRGPGGGRSPLMPGRFGPGGRR